MLQRNSYQLSDTPPLRSSPIPPPPPAAARRSGSDPAPLPWRRAAAGRSSRSTLPAPPWATTRFRIRPRGAEGGIHRRRNRLIPPFFGAAGDWVRLMEVGSEIGGGRGGHHESVATGVSHLDNKLQKTVLVELRQRSSLK